MFVPDLKFLEGLHQPAPRYTSYPTIKNWIKKDSNFALKALNKLNTASEHPISLYFHFPFCKKMCLYCACSVFLNRKPENEHKYIEYLIKEIKIVVSSFSKKRKVSQIHFGGGSPSLISPNLLIKLFDVLSLYFEITPKNEICIEIDPRSLATNPHILKCLHELKFNRISLGVQDTNLEVQKAIHRNQSFEQTLYCYKFLQKLGFTSINIDLIYGLPKQTADTFKQTIKKIIELYPNRIALFSFAHVPWLKPHQKALKIKDLPSIEEKFKMYSNSRHTLLNHHYYCIGMDHFAQEKDSLTLCYLNKTLIRNFQGYSVPYAEDLIGFGVSATGFIQNHYLQNHKDLNLYYEAIDKNQIPTAKGKYLSDDDIIRKWTIHKIMCSFEIDKLLFHSLFNSSFDTYFFSVKEKLVSLELSGLIINSPHLLKVTQLGELFVRVIATVFDNYLFTSNKNNHQYSFSI